MRRQLEQSDLRRRAREIKRKLLESEAENDSWGQRTDSFLESFGIKPSATKEAGKDEEQDIQAAEQITKVFREEGLVFTATPDKLLKDHFRRNSPIGQVELKLSRETVPWPDLEESGAISATFEMSKGGEAEERELNNPHVRNSTTISFISPEWLRGALQAEETPDQRKLELLQWLQNVGPGTTGREAEMILVGAEGADYAAFRAGRVRGFADGALTTIPCWIPANGSQGITSYIGRITVFVFASRKLHNSTSAPWVFVTPVLPKNNSKLTNTEWYEYINVIVSQTEAAWGRERNSIDSGTAVASVMIDGAIRAASEQVRTLSRDLESLEANDPIIWSRRRRRQLDVALARVRDVARGIDELEQAVRDVEEEDSVARISSQYYEERAASQLLEDWRLLEARYRRVDDQYRNEAQRESRRLAEFMGTTAAIISAFVVGPSLVFAGIAISDNWIPANESYAPHPMLTLEYGLYGLAIGIFLVVVAVLIAVAFGGLQRWLDRR